MPDMPKAMKTSEPSWNVSGRKWRPVSDAVLNGENRQNANHRDNVADR
jgi:hypothetical protein